MNYKQTSFYLVHGWHPRTQIDAMIPPKDEDVDDIQAKRWRNKHCRERMAVNPCEISKFGVHANNKVASKGKHSANRVSSSVECVPTTPCAVDLAAQS
jgi:hypothetical protein